MFKMVVSALLFSLPLSSVVHAQATDEKVTLASLSDSPPTSSQLAIENVSLADSASVLFLAHELAEQTGPSPATPASHHRLRTFVIIIAVTITLVILAAVYIGQHN